MTLNEEPQTRRRGSALERVLLDATWEELSEHGYDALTIDGVAARAGTSRPVIYRRWAGKPELVLAALLERLKAEPIDLPDTGTLRGDLIAVMRQANELRVPAILIGARLGAFYRDSGTSRGGVRDLVVGNVPGGVETILDRAIARGEIDPTRLTPRIAQLPLDLYRHEVLVTSSPVPDHTIEQIIDTVVLPLIAHEGDAKR